MGVFAVYVDLLGCLIAFNSVGIYTLVRYLDGFVLLWLLCSLLLIE